MKNLVTLIAVISCLFLNACEKDQLFGESNPVRIQEFKIDGVSYDEENLLTTTFSLAIGDGIGLHYLLQDDRKIANHSLYFLVNDDDTRRSQLQLDEDLNSEWMHVEQYFYLANLMRLESDEIYAAQSGDELYFYLVVQDKAKNESVRKFIVEVD